jgi:hypothetical protein
MKKHSNLFGFLLMISVCIYQSCGSNQQKIGNFSDDLSPETKTNITNEIMDLTTNWAKAHCSMDADKAIELWDASRN